MALPSNQFNPKSSPAATTAKKGGKKAAPKDETKAAKFSRIASARMTKVLKNIKTLGNLSGSGYEFTPEQVNKMAELIKSTTQITLAKFSKDPAAKKAEDAVTI